MLVTIARRSAAALAALLSLGLALGMVALLARNHSAVPASAVREASAPGSARVVTFRAGDRERTYSGFAAWRIRLQPGVHQATFKAGVVPTAEDPTRVICGLVKLDTLGPRTRVYAAETATHTGPGLPAFLSGAETFRVFDDTQLGLVCTVENGGDFTLFDQARASFEPVGDRRLRTAPEVPIDLGRRLGFTP